MEVFAVWLLNMLVTNAHVHHSSLAQIVTDSSIHAYPAHVLMDHAVKYSEHRAMFARAMLATPE